MMERSITLYELQAEMMQLVEALEEATPEQRPELEGYLRLYVQAEVEKVDGIRAYIRHHETLATAAREEAQIQLGRAQQAQRRVDGMKAFIHEAMSFSGKKKLEGRTGAFTICGNGGVQPMELEADQVPDEYCDYTISLPVQVLTPFLATIRKMLGFPPKLERIPKQDRIREQLARPCAACGGSGSIPSAATDRFPAQTCQLCGGDGKNHIPGARLLERGSHVRVK